MQLLLLCALFSPSLSLAWRDPGFCINRPARVSACYYNNTLAISHTLSPSLESIPSLFLYGNRRMWPPPWVQLDFDFSLLLLLAGDVSLNPGPSACGLRLGTVNARSMWDKAPALLDLVTSKGMDHLRHYWDLAGHKGNLRRSCWNDPQGFSFHKPRAQQRGGGVGLFVSSAHIFSTISLPAQQVLRLYLAKLNVVSHALLSSISIAHRSCYYFLQWVIRYPVVHIYTSSWSGSDGGLQCLYWFLIIRCQTAIWYFGVFRSPSLSGLSHPHTRPSSRPYDLLFRMQCSICFDLWFDFRPLFCCCQLANAIQP